MRIENLPVKPCNLCSELKAVRLLYRKEHYSIVRCETCSLTYTDGIPFSTAELGKIYSADYFAKGAKYEVRLTNVSCLNAEQRLKQVLALNDLRLDKWLDVGCATGDFLVAAKSLVKEVHGIEISNFAASQARARGLDKVTVVNFLEADLLSNEFDLVSMWDVIEHLQDPKAAFKKAFEILKPGGYLVLSTGDIQSKLARLTGRYWHLMTPQDHLYFFSQLTMERMLMATGFHLISISYPGKRVPLDFMIHKLSRLFLPKASNSVLRLVKLFRLGKVVPTVNLADIMTIQARKSLE